MNEVALVAGAYLLGLGALALYAALLERRSGRVEEALRHVRGEGPPEPGHEPSPPGHSGHAGRPTVPGDPKASSM